jgi:cobalt-zinc-cadmium efflux system protein
MKHNHHSHDHGHGATKESEMGVAFAWGIGLNSIFIVTEIVFGILSGSMALIADAVHNLSDVIGLVMSWVAMILSKKNPQGRYTYGYRSATILSVLLSTVILFVAVGGIMWSAITRIGEPVEVESIVIMIVASVGIFINGLSAWLLSRGKSDLNVKGAFLHLVADAAVSAGVVIAAIIIYFTGWTILDPIISIVISAVVLYSGWGVLRDAIRLSLNATPDSVSLDEVKTYLRSLSGVSRIHDIHIWSMSTTEIAMTGHLVMPSFTGDDQFLHDICHDMKERFGIGHATFQIEKGEGAECELEPDEVV